MHLTFLAVQTWFARAFVQVFVDCLGNFTYCKSISGFFIPGVGVLKRISDPDSRSAVKALKFETDYAATFTYVVPVQ